jgi:hypothetical protein
VTADTPLAEFEIASGVQRGSRLTLYANRLVHHGGDSMEAVPLGQLAAVRVAFERDARKLNWAIGLLVCALILAMTSGPLQAWMSDLTSKVAASPVRESLEAVLIAVFTALGHLARLLLPIAVMMVAGAAALLYFFWLGRTTLTFSFAAVERDYAVRGRDAFMIQFAELVAAQLAARKG